ncbi:hypothetical protein [Phormidium sp. CCY1219]|nr:hypothetical protein [Phormidium sp. CCY1219]MEB3827768.1 hypothetical protein [Phormidium sp. CCY1219]
MKDKPVDINLAPSGLKNFYGGLKEDVAGDTSEGVGRAIGKILLKKQ